MKTIRYKFNHRLFSTEVPDNWPDDAVAEVCAFRCGANPGDVFELVPQDGGTFVLLATGGAV